jgi:hypothetical protein
MHPHASDPLGRVRFSQELPMASQPNSVPRIPTRHPRPPEAQGWSSFIGVCALVAALIIVMIWHAWRT